MLRRIEGADLPGATMPEHAKVTFYTVVRCGYYLRAHAIPEFGSLSETLAELLAWVAPGENPLDHTSTYTPGENGEGGLRTFCAGMHRNQQGEFLLTTWNELSNQHGSITSIDVSERVGTAIPTVQEHDANLVPGYPAYFWFVPQRDLVINIRFDTERLSGTRSMNHYVQGFLNHFSPHVLLDDPDEDVEHNVTGYAQTADSAPVPVHPKFQCVQRHRPQHIQGLRARCPNIRQVIRKSVIASGTGAERRHFAAFFRAFGIHDTPEAIPDIRARSELNFTPSPEQFDQMVANWEEADGDNWQDVGFKFHGGNKVEWLSDGASRFDTELDVDRGDRGFIGARELLAALSARRTRILSLIGE